MGDNARHQSGGEPVSELRGLAGSAGFAIGSAIIVDQGRPGVVRRRIQKHSADDEMSRFDRAVGEAAGSLREVAARARPRAAESSILEAYLLMVEDETLREDVERRIRIDLQCAEWALRSSVNEMSEQLRSGDDPYLAERSHDFEFVGDRILGALIGRGKPLGGQRTGLLQNEMQTLPQPIEPQGCIEFKAAGGDA